MIISALFVGSASGSRKAERGDSKLPTCRWTAPSCRCVRHPPHVGHAGPSCRPSARPAAAWRRARDAAVRSIWATGIVPIVDIRPAFLGRMMFNEVGQRQLYLGPLRVPALIKATEDRFGGHHMAGSLARLVGIVDGIGTLSRIEIPGGIVQSPSRNGQSSGTGALQGHPLPAEDARIARLTGSVAPAPLGMLRVAEKIDCGLSRST